MIRKALLWHLLLLFTLMAFMAPASKAETVDTCISSTFPGWFLTQNDYLGCSFTQNRWWVTSALDQYPGSFRAQAGLRAPTGRPWLRTSVRDDFALLRAEAERHPVHGNEQTPARPQTEQMQHRDTAGIGEAIS